MVVRNKFWRHSIRAEVNPGSDFFWGTFWQNLKIWRPGSRGGAQLLEIKGLGVKLPAFYAWRFSNFFLIKTMHM